MIRLHQLLAKNKLRVESMRIIIADHKRKRVFLEDLTLEYFHLLFKLLNVSEYHLDPEQMFKLRRLDELQERTYQKAYMNIKIDIDDIEDIIIYRYDRGEVHEDRIRKNNKRNNSSNKKDE
jgi:hypothetical protein